MRSSSIENGGTLSTASLARHSHREPSSNALSQDTFSCLQAETLFDKNEILTKPPNIY